MAGYHRKARAPRAAWQVIIPVFTLGALLCLGIVTAVLVHSRGSAAPKAVAAAPSPKVHQVVTTPPPAKPVPSSPAYYTVASGDSWWSIAVQYCNSGDAYVTLANRNHVPVNAALPVGRKIVIQCRLGNHLLTRRKDTATAILHIR